MNKLAFIVAFICSNCFCLNEYDVAGVHLRIKGKLPDAANIFVVGEENDVGIRELDNVVPSRSIGGCSYIEIVFKRSCKVIEGRDISIKIDDKEYTFIVEKHNEHKALFLKNPRKNSLNFDLYEYLRGGGFTYTLVTEDNVNEFQHYNKIRQYRKVGEKGAACNR
jgi:hypothetical protein